MADLTGMLQAAAGSGGAPKEYIGVCYNGAPYFTLLDHSVPGTLTLAATYQVLRDAKGVGFSPDGAYIAIAHDSTSGAKFTLLNHDYGSVSLAATYVLSGNGQAARFSPDGNYIAVGTSSSPNFVLLNHTVPGTVSLSATYTTNAFVFGVNFSPDGNYIGCSIYSGGGPYFTLLNHTTPGSVSLATTYNINNFSMYHEFTSGYIALAFNNTTFTLINHSGASVSLASTYTMTGQGRGVSFNNPTGNYIAVGRTASPYFVLLNRSGGSMSLATTYALSSTAEAVSFNASGDYIAISSSAGLTLLDHTTPGTVSLATTYIVSPATRGGGMIFSPQI